MSSNNGVAVLILYNDNKELLFQLRSPYKQRLGGYWGLFGGHIEDGEETAETLRREIYEELGYKVHNPTFLYTQVFPDKPKHVFVAPYDKSQELKVDTKETQKIGWFSLAEALKLKIIPHDAEVLEKVAEYLEKI